MTISSLSESEMRGLITKVGRQVVLGKDRAFFTIYICDKLSKTDLLLSFQGSIKLTIPSVFVQQQHLLF